MTLKEQFNKNTCKDCDMPYCDIPCMQISDKELQRFEKIADKYAIDFAVWYENLLAGGDFDKINKSKKTLLEIYKEEKGL